MIYFIIEKSEEVIGAAKLSVCRRNVARHVSITTDFCEHLKVYLLAS
jgi:hypothetical protein